jgi:ABC-type Fe3+/spermidine/putrescine transport system ATPase subunit
MGTPSEVYETPRSRFVADFIGVSNFFEAHVEAEAPGCLSVRTRGGMPIQLTPATRPIAAGETLHLTLRPEKVSMEPLQAAGTPNACAATITHIVYLGMMTHYYTRTEHGETLIVYMQNQDIARQHLGFAVGDAVTLSWQPHHVLLLEEG